MNKQWHNQSRLTAAAALCTTWEGEKRGQKKTSVTAAVQSCPLCSGNQKSYVAASLGSWLCCYASEINHIRTSVPPRNQWYHYPINNLEGRGNNLNSKASFTPNVCEWFSRAKSVLAPPQVSGWPVTKGWEQCVLVICKCYQRGKKNHKDSSFQRILTSTSQVLKTVLY